MIRITDTLLDDFSISLFERGVDSIYSALLWEFPELKLAPEDAKEEFLYVLQALLTRGRVKLGMHNQLLEGSIAEQIQAFKDAWPNEDRFDPGLFTYTKSNVVGKKELGLEDWIPGDLVWVDEDGKHWWS
jgi:hypothetical protein